MRKYLGRNNLYVNIVQTKNLEIVLLYFWPRTAGTSDAGGFSNVWWKEADQTHDHTGGLSPDPYLYDTASLIHID